MQIDIRVPPFAPIPEVVDFTRRCEEAGFAGVGFVDSQLLLRDVFMAMGQAAASTSRIRLMPAVTNPLTRHVSVLASAAKSVGDQAPGRVEVWIGRGFSSVNIVGLPYATVRQMRETMVDLKRLLAGEWDVYPGVHSILHHGGEPTVPIYLASRGPLGTRLAGELCEGILMAAPPNAEGIALHRKWLAEGAARAGRDVAEVHEVLQLSCTIRETMEEARRCWAPRLATMLAGDDAQEQARRLGFEGEIGGLRAQALKALEVIQSLYPDPGHAQDRETAIKASEFVPKDMLARFCETRGAIGNPDYVLARLKELQKLDVKHVYLFGIETFQLPEPERRAFQEVIGPGLGSSS